jgi:hypothetical protein
MVKFKNGNFMFLSADFDLMMKQAPIIDLRDKNFIEEDAVLYARTMRELFAQGCQSISLNFGMQFLGFAKKIADYGENEAPKHFKELLPEVKGFEAMNPADKFVKAYFIQNLEDGAPIMEGALYLEGLTAKFSKPFKANEYSKMTSYVMTAKDLKKLAPFERAEAAKRMREYETKFRLVIYHPASSEDEFVKRRREWSIFDSVASQFENGPR